MIAARQTAADQTAQPCWCAPVPRSINVRAPRLLRTPWALIAAASRAANAGPCQQSLKAQPQGKHASEATRTARA